MPNDNIRKCDECGIKLNGECIVDGALLLCYDCAENLDNEREFDGPLDDSDLGDTIIDTDFF